MLQLDELGERDQRGAVWRVAQKVFVGRGSAGDFRKNLSVNPGDQRQCARERGKARLGVLDPGLGQRGIDEELRQRDTGRGHRFMHGELSEVIQQGPGLRLRSPQEMQHGENGLKSHAERIAGVIDRVEMPLDFRMKREIVGPDQRQQEKQSVGAFKKHLPSADFLCVEFERLAIFGDRLVVAAFEKIHRSQQKMTAGRRGFRRRLRHGEDLPLRGREVAGRNIDTQQRPFEFGVAQCVLTVAVMGQKGRHVGGRLAGRQQAPELDPEQPELNIEIATGEPGHVQDRIREQVFQNVRTIGPAVGFVIFGDREAEGVAVIFVDRQSQSDARARIRLWGIRIINGASGGQKNPAHGFGGFGPLRRGDHLDREGMAQQFGTGKIRVQQSQRQQPV